MSKRALEPDERGDVAYKKRCFAVARTHYDEAIQPSPHEMVFYANKAAALYEEGKYDECISTGEMALEVGSEDKSQVANVMVVIAKAKKSQGKISEALDWLKKASAMYPDPRIDELKADLQIGAVRRPLSNAYPSKLISVLMDIQNHKESCKRTRTLVLSSPIMSIFFEQFMEKFTVAIRNHFFINFFDRKAIDDPAAKAVYAKVWSSLSWFVPFIVDLAIDDSRQSIMAHDILPRTSSVLKSFSLHVEHLSYDPIHPNVVLFIQRQLPNLQTLCGPIELFLTLSPNLPEPTVIKDAVIVIRDCKDVETYFLPIWSKLCTPFFRSCRL